MYDIWYMYKYITVLLLLLYGYKKRLYFLTEVYALKVFETKEAREYLDLNEQLRSFVIWPCIVEMVKSTKVRWVGHVDRLRRHGKHKKVWWEIHQEFWKETMIRKYWDGWWQKTLNWRRMDLALDRVKCRTFPLSVLNFRVIFPVTSKKTFKIVLWVILGLLDDTFSSSDD
jgi:hypothetical protein